MSNEKNAELTSKIIEAYVMSPSACTKEELPLMVAMEPPDSLSLWRTSSSWGAPNSLCISNSKSGQMYVHHTLLCEYIKKSTLAEQDKKILEAMEIGLPFLNDVLNTVMNHYCHIEDQALDNVNKFKAAIKILQERVK